MRDAVSGAPSIPAVLVKASLPGCVLLPLPGERGLVVTDATKSWAGCDQKDSVHVTTAGFSLLERRKDSTSSQSTQPLGALQTGRGSCEALRSPASTRLDSVGAAHTPPGAETSTGVAERVILAAPKPPGVPHLRLRRQAERLPDAQQNPA